MFKSLISGEMTVTSFILCTVASIILGLALALSYMIKNKSYKSSFIVSLAVLPVIVQLVIAMVNGNIGVGVAVAGGFSLIRFRSAQGTAKEITYVFASMAIGLATGMGYVWIAAIFTVIIILLNLVYTFTKFGERNVGSKTLKITIPENLDYTTLFDDLFETYTSSSELERVRMTGMGSMYQLTYKISLKDDSKEKELIDAIRCRNGNLEISCGRTINDKEDTL